MTKQQLQPYNNIQKDLLFWIKHFLCSKIATQKLDTDFTDDVKKYNKSTDGNIKLFDRDLYQKLMLEMNSIDEVEELAKKVTKNGLKSHVSIFTPIVHFYKYIKDTKSIDSIKKINTNQVNTWMMLSFKEKSDWTKKTYYTMIKGLFIFIDKYSISEDNFIFDIGMTSYGTKAKLPINNNPKKSEKYLEPNEFVKMASKIKDLKSRHPNQAQLRLLLKVISFTGIRATEARFIRLEDIGYRTIKNNKYMQLFIRGKGKSDRYVFIDYRLIQREFEQDVEFRKENDVKCNYLFYNSSLEQHKEKSMYDLINRSFTRLGVFKPIDTHGLRKSMSVYYHARGVSLETISLILGHSDESAVDFYVFATKHSYKGVKDLFKNI
jgi:site-specific recombinase XerD